MLRRAALAASLLLLLTFNSAAASNATVTIKDFQFVNGSPTVGLGDSVSWLYPTGSSPQGHTASSILTPGTWGAMSWNFAFPSAGPGSQTHVFHEAGGWQYHCLIHSFMKGTVSVRFKTTSASGPLGTTFVLTLGNQALPSGFIHDVQKRKAGGSFKTWKHTTASTQSFKPSKKGSYQLRVRVRDTANSQATLYSPTITITVS